MRILLTIALMAIAAPAGANSGADNARALGLLEWAEEKCGRKADVAEVKAHMEHVIRGDWYGIVRTSKLELDRMAQRHGKEAACEAATSALRK